MKHFRLFAILLLLVCKWTTVAHGQTQEPAINIEFTDIPLSEAISRIEKSSKYTFFYDAKQTDLTLRVSLHAKQLPISAALRQMLAPTGLDFTISERQIALIPAARKAPAGSRTITGTVNDSHELPLAGVAVTLEGDNTRGTVSGNNGSFTITVPDADAVLSFTYLGYISKKVSVPVSQNSLEVFLAEDAVRMEDVVVVGYGTQKKVNLTGAITTVDDTQLANRSAPSVAHMLQGAVPGLTISTSSGRPGNSADLNIRGITSINGGSPLVLIDGAEGDLMKLNPNDVASISVIKDASAAAIYGARAAYGVVLVTTKEGDDSDKTRVSYSGRWGWNSPTTSTDYETRGYYSVYVNDLFWHADAGTNYTNYTEQDMMELWARRNDISGSITDSKSRTSVGEDRPARRPRHICLLRQLRLVPLPVQGRASQHEPQRLAVGRQLEGEVHAFGQLLQRRGTLPSGPRPLAADQLPFENFVRHQQVAKNQQ